MTAGTTVMMQYMSLYKGGKLMGNNMISLAKKLLNYTIVSATLVFIALCIFYSYILRCIITPYSSNFEYVGGEVYIEKSVKIKDKDTFMSLLDQAEYRIKNKFGELPSSPTIIVVSNDEMANKYGLGDGPGLAHIVPWGQYIIINNSKSGIDVLAHELLHAKVAETLGYWVWQTVFPVWLNEGLSMQVDDRPQYNSGSESMHYKDFSYIISIVNSSGFWTNNKDKNIENYRFSKAAAAEIFKHKEAKNLYSMLGNVRGGASVAEIFGVEKARDLLKDASLTLKSSKR